MLCWIINQNKTKPCTKIFGTIIDINHKNYVNVSISLRISRKKYIFVSIMLAKDADAHFYPTLPVERLKKKILSIIL